MSKKVAVVGGAGQAGRIHVSNLLELGADVAVVDLMPNEEAKTFFDAKQTSYGEVISQGYEIFVVALPDNILKREATRLLNENNAENLKAVMVEKPGSLKSKDLSELVALAEMIKVPLFINYQRSFEPRIDELTKKIAKLVNEEGYELDYVSIHSCDKAQPPQAAHQALNQGCHDYALLLHLFQTLNLEINSEKFNAHGVNWDSLNDTKFLRIGGIGSSKDRKGSTVFDVKMSRVSSLGTYTKFEVHLSKHKNSDSLGNLGMYAPVEISMQFPEQFDATSTWADTWADAFKASMKALITYGDKGAEFDPVPAKFGVDVLKFAENVIEVLQ